MQSLYLPFKRLAAVPLLKKMNKRPPSFYQSGNLSTVLR